MLDEDKEKTIYEYFSEEEIFWEKTPKELSVIAGKKKFQIQRQIGSREETRMRKSRKKCLWSMETIRSSTALQS